MKPMKMVYQRTDRFEEFPDVDTDKIGRFDRKLKSNADLTIYVNKTLYDNEKAQCKKALYLDHGVDFEIFAGAEQNPELPEDIAEIPRPIAGYFGAIDKHKLDKDFIGNVADMLPNMSFVFIGSASSDYSSLSARKNVWMLGQKTYDQIPHYGKCFDIAIIPWRKNRWTAAANPIKLKEYLALGKPVVTTPAFTEVQRYLDIIYQAESAQDFAENIKKALSEDSPERIEKRKKRVAHSSWDNKAETVLSQLFS
jgi:glycosyltransferase involved in cell wall biosynthesis